MGLIQWSCLQDKTILQDTTMSPYLENSYIVAEQKCGTQLCVYNVYGLPLSLSCFNVILGSITAFPIRPFQGQLNIFSRKVLTEWLYSHGHSNAVVVHMILGDR